MISQLISKLKAPIINIAIDAILDNITLTPKAQQFIKNTAGIDKDQYKEILSYIVLNAPSLLSSVASNIPVDDKNRSNVASIEHGELTDEV